jgi:hypothetical protein
MKVVRLSALSTGRLYPQVLYMVLIIVTSWVNSRAIVLPEGLCQWKSVLRRGQKKWKRKDQLLCWHSKHSLFALHIYTNNTIFLVPIINLNLHSILGHCNHKEYIKDNCLRTMCCNCNIATSPSTHILMMWTSDIWYITIRSKNARQTDNN